MGMSRYGADFFLVPKASLGNVLVFKAVLCPVRIYCAASADMAEREAQLQEQARYEVQLRNEKKARANLLENPDFADVAKTMFQPDSEPAQTEHLPSS